MRLPIRFRVRTVMAIIALVALGFGITFELKNDAERDRLLWRQADLYRQAAIHHKRALECKVAEETHQPYRPLDRTKLLVGDRVRRPVPPGGFPSWQAEMLNHEYWGNRLCDQADGSDRDLEAVQAKLLFPGPSQPLTTAISGTPLLKNVQIDPIVRS